MTNALRDGLYEHEFRERYILRRVLCETYINRNILDTFKYNTVIPEGGDYIHILKGPYGPCRRPWGGMGGGIPIFDDFFFDQQIIKNSFQVPGVFPANSARQNLPRAPE